MNFLEDILSYKKELIKKTDISAIKDNEISKKFSFSQALYGKDKIKLIAEVKKASPSKGVFRNNFDAEEIYNIYADSGANAVSVLTEDKYFFGSSDILYDLSRIKRTPLLRKDFIIDEIQIYESYYLGADAVLLISEILTIRQIEEYSTLANELGMDVLLELHSINQLDKINFDRNKIIGINNRNLIDFSVDPDVTKQIVKEIPEDILIVSESGIRTQNYINFLKNLNIDAVLVGEAFIKSDDIRSAVQTFIDWC